MTNVLWRLALIFVIIDAALLTDSDNYKNYEGYNLVRLIPQTESQLTAIDRLKTFYDNSDEQIEFWQSPSFVNRSADVLVGPESRNKFFRMLRRSSVVFESEIDNIGGFLRNERRTSIFSNLRRSHLFHTENEPESDKFNFLEFHSHDEINAFLDDLAERNSAFVSVDELGKSFEKRSLKYVKIGYPSEQPKNALFVDAGIHAREWIAPAVAVYFINELVTKREYEKLLREIDIYVLPSLNPDGYEYTLTKDRFWRKTRSGPRGKHCYGVDANRNFPFLWGGNGVSKNPCDKEIYCGPAPLSEPETLALGKFLSKNRHTIKGYVTLHSYGNFIIFPWGARANITPHDVEDLENLAIKISQAIYQANEEQYDVGTSFNLLNYLASGASDDYAKFLGIKYTYTFELTNTRYGFLVPSSFIEPTAIGITKGLVVLAEEIAKQIVVE